jgi:hypothetical protein
LEWKVADIKKSVRPFSLCTVTPEADPKEDRDPEFLHQGPPRRLHGHDSYLRERLGSQLFHQKVQYGRCPPDGIMNKMRSVGVKIGAPMHQAGIVHAELCR